MKEQAFVSTQNNTAANHSVCNWTEKGEQQSETTFNHPFQSSCSLLDFSYTPPSGVNPSSPSPNCSMTHCHEKKDFMFCLWAWFISMFGGLNSRFGNVLLHSATAAWFRGSDSTSLDVAVVIRAVCLWHIHLSHGVTHMVHPVPARWHALVDAVKALSFLKAGDLVLGGEATDSWQETKGIWVNVLSEYS